MILRAQADFGLDLARSVLVGDKDSDIEAGRAAGVRYNMKLDHHPSAAASKESLAFPDLPSVLAWLREHYGIDRMHAAP
jgi:D-glycero-D-manno-heptose 1,7-bisphosphate phosphatase